MNKNVIGIDLGTTNSALAALNSIGKPTIVPNSEGERITPSAVYFEEDGDIVVGKQAFYASKIDDSRFIRFIKRYMGDEYYPKAIDNKKYSPAKLVSYILKKVVKDAEEQIGEIFDVVITVPAYFDEVRRKATMEAGELAGLNVIGIVNEPTAAALYYATEHRVSGKVLVFDFGGGTLDITVLNVNGTDIDVICSRGDHNLGGFNIDEKIVKLVDGCYENQYGETLTKYNKRIEDTFEKAEDIKKVLSTRNKMSKIFLGDKGEIQFVITREDFEKSIVTIISKIEMMIEDVLEETNLEPNEIDEIVLVGGSTRIPIIQEKLEEIFRKKPKKVGNVDECVALGAAIYAGLCMLEKNINLSYEMIESLNSINLKEVCNHSYGTYVITEDKILETVKLANDIIIPKNSQIPCSIERTYYTSYEGQAAIEVKITQGESEDIDMVNILCQEVMDLPPSRPVGCPIVVKYSYDKNQRMHCRFHDILSGEIKIIEMDMKGNDQNYHSVG